MKKKSNNKRENFLKFRYSYPDIRANKSIMKNPSSSLLTNFNKNLFLFTKQSISDYEITTLNSSMDKGMELDNIINNTL